MIYDIFCNWCICIIEDYTKLFDTYFDIINIDTIGPLEKDEHGNEYILAIIDCFSRWIELYAIPDTKGLTAARCLLQHVGRFGCPSFIRHDGGPQFVNEVLDNFARLTHTEQQRTTAYSSEENAIVERSHKETLRHLRAIIYNDRVKSHWSSDQLPLVQRILNSEEKTRTGISPAELLFGNAIDLNKHFLYQPIPDTSKPRDKNLPEYFEKLLDRQKVLIEVAQENQHKFDTQHRMSKYDPNFTEFPINSYVLLEHPGGNRKKLQTKKQGPFQVVNIVGSTYTIQNLINHKTMDVHISTLRKRAVWHNSTYSHSGSYIPLFPLLITSVTLPLAISPHLLDYIYSLCILIVSNKRLL